LRIAPVIFDLPVVRYTMSQKKPGHLMFYHNFGKCELIYKTFNCQILQKLARFDDENLKPHCCSVYPVFKLSIVTSYMLKYLFISFLSL